MKRSDAVIGGVYVARVAGRLARVRILGPTPFGGWRATNIGTRRPINITSARLRARRLGAAAAARSGGVAPGPIRMPGMRKPSGVRGQSPRGFGGRAEYHLTGAPPRCTS